jgi:hypothetical protein
LQVTDNATTTLLIGENRKGANGRALAAVDLYRVMLKNDNPGREISAAEQRLGEFKAMKVSPLIEIGLEDEFLQFATAAQTWMIGNVEGAKSHVLIKAWKDLKTIPDFEMPMLLQIEFAAKIVKEYAVENKWKKWRSVVSVGNTRFDAENPHFPDPTQCEPEQLIPFKKAWQQSVLCNSVINTIMKVERNDPSTWADFKLISDMLLVTSDDITKQTDDDLNDIFTPCTRLMFAIRLVIDHTPFAAKGFHEDMHYAFPTEKMLEDGGEYFANSSVLNARTVLRAIQNALKSCIADWRKTEGAEAEVGGSLNDFVEQARKLSELTKDSLFKDITNVADVYEELVKVKSVFKDINDTVLPRLRSCAAVDSGASDHMAELLRWQWRRQEAAIDGDVFKIEIEDMADFESLCELSGATALQQSVQDVIATKGETIRKEAFAKALRTPLADLAACQALKCAIVVADTLPKTEEHFESLRSVFPKVFTVMKAAILAGGPDVACAQAIALLRKLISERGVVGQKTELRKQAEAMIEISIVTSKWEIDLVAIRASPACQKHALEVAFDNARALSSQVDLACSIAKPWSDSEAKTIYLVPL